MKVNNYEVTYDDKLIYLTCKNGIYTTSNTNELMQLFCSGELGSLVTNGKTEGDYPKFDKCFNRKKHRNIYLSHISYCNYHRGLTKENYISVLADFRSELSKGTKNEKNVDHLNNDNRDCSITNLWLVSKGFNSKKVTAENTIYERRKYKCIQNGKSIFHLIKAIDENNNVRIEFAYISSYFRHRVKVIRYISHSPDDTLNMLEHISKSKWNIRQQKNGVDITENYSFIGHFPFLHTLTLDSSIEEARQRLIGLPLSDFERWESQY